jgi:hypothetical protein
MPERVWPFLNCFPDFETLDFSGMQKPEGLFLNLDSERKRQLTEPILKGEYKK